MTREVELVSYLPPYLQEYEQQNAALTAENPEFILVWNAVDKVLYNEFIATADEYGISRFEDMLGILPFAEDTLESRRTRIQSRWFTSIPYTMKSLLTKLITLCGKNNFTVTKQFEKYQIRIETNLELFGQVDELENIVSKMFPCNTVPVLDNQLLCDAEGSENIGGGVVFTEMISTD